MNQEDVLQKVRERIRFQFEGEGTGHDWWHIFRVVQNALTIGEKEGADLFLVELSALVHDVGDHKFHNGDESLAEGLISELLSKEGVAQDTIGKVNHIVKHVSYKGAEVETPMDSIEGKVVQDADRLDAIGAIGVARAFAYGGAKSRELYNPNQKPNLHLSFDDYKKDNGHTINHFYEKLLLLKDRMQTATGKQMAAERHQFMEQYLQQFYKEWEGSS